MQHRVRQYSIAQLSLVLKLLLLSMHLVLNAGFAEVWQPPSSSKDCKFRWLPWSPCSVSCGGGSQHRRPHIKKMAQWPAKRCPQPQQRECGMDICPPPTPSPTPPTAAPTHLPTPILQCPAGKARVGNRHCKLCRPGFFSTRGSDACMRRAAGRYGLGASVSFKCNGKCTAGHFSSAAGSTLCSPCDSGRFQSRTGMSMCFGCPQGKFQGAYASLSCQKCAAGRFSHRSSDACRLELAGGGEIVSSRQETVQITPAPTPTGAPTLAPAPTPPLCQHVVIISLATNPNISGSCSGFTGTYTLTTHRTITSTDVYQLQDAHVSKRENRTYYLFSSIEGWWFASLRPGSPPFCLSSSARALAPYVRGLTWTGPAGNMLPVHIACVTKSPTPLPSPLPTPQATQFPTQIPTPRPTQFPTPRPNKTRTEASMRKVAAKEARLLPGNGSTAAHGTVPPSFIGGAVALCTTLFLLVSWKVRSATTVTAILTDNADEAHGVAVAELQGLVQVDSPIVWDDMDEPAALPSVSISSAQHARSTTLHRAPVQLPSVAIQPGPFYYGGFQHDRNISDSISAANDDI